MISLVTLFGGRPRMLEMTFAAIDGLDFPKDQLQIVWVTNSDDAVFLRTLRREFEDRKEQYAGAVLVEMEDLPPSQCANRESYKPDQPEHARIIARMYNRAMACCDGDLVFCIEDDVFVPSYSLKCLLPHLDNPAVVLACGAMFSRHDERDLWAWDIRQKVRIVTDSEGQPQKISDHVGTRMRKTWGVQPVGLTHLGVTLFRRQAMQEVGGFKPEHPASTTLRGCDMVMNLDFHMRGWKRLIDFNVVSLHFDSNLVPH